MTYTLSLEPAPQTKDPFAPFVAILAKGKHGSRSLTFDEARDAMRLILSGEASEMQIGAFLMLLRVQEEEPEELAGFVTACREAIPHSGIGADLDWSSYAGKKRQLPWFILSSLALADAGVKVFMHGTGGHTAGRLYTEDALRTLGIPIHSQWETAQQELEQNHFAFMPLSAINPKLEQLIHLKSVLGVRSMINTITRLMAPSLANTSLHSIFHPAYAEKHQKAAKQLGYQDMTVFKGDGGEIEIRPGAKNTLFSLQNGEELEWIIPRTFKTKPEDSPVHDLTPLVEYWRENNGNSGDQSEYAQSAVIGTLSAALLTLGESKTPEQAQIDAVKIWQQRNKKRL